MVGLTRPWGTVPVAEGASIPRQTPQRRDETKKGGYDDALSGRIGCDRGHGGISLGADQRAGGRIAAPSISAPRLSLTGKYASNGQNTQNGYEFAVKKINDAGGVTVRGKCYHFKVKYYDDESTPARAAQLIDRLIDQDKIQYILGPYSSPMTKAILPVIEKYKIPLVQSEAASRSLFTQGYKYQFGIIATSEKYLSPVVDLGRPSRQAGRQETVEPEGRHDLPGRCLLARRAPGRRRQDEEIRDEDGHRRPHAAGLERHHRLPDQGEGDQARRADRLRPRKGRGHGHPPDGRVEDPGAAGRHDALRSRPK